MIVSIKRGHFSTSSCYYQELEVDAVCPDPSLKQQKLMDFSWGCHEFWITNGNSW